ncbi:hypothetical protein HanRHA438_Chr17g0828451 [Helianthus annuus]|nr:hypothetical protein HanRHA438_Chr17g0828451 [Helianthus annuus]
MVTTPNQQCNGGMWRPHQQCFKNDEPMQDGKEATAATAQAFEVTEIFRVKY